MSGKMDDMADDARTDEIIDSLEEEDLEGLTERKEEMVAAAEAEQQD